MSQLPAGYSFIRVGDTHQLRGPQDTLVTGLLRPDSPDADLVATMHWIGYKAGVEHALRRVKNAAKQHGVVPDFGDDDVIGELRHDLIVQIHIV